jgi:hypothetical protein
MRCAAVDDARQRHSRRPLRGNCAHLRRHPHLHPCTRVRLAQVPLPFFLRAATDTGGIGLSRPVVGTFLGLYIIVYGQIQVRTHALVGAWWGCTQSGVARPWNLCNDAGKGWNASLVVNCVSLSAVSLGGKNHRGTMTSPNIPQGKMY